ncbi:hypothetical protein Q5H93_10440 [Hymenobacter sp. ASUV-10]|uniref:Outer membrane protein beta-barrel domain-containing protein n=1 Tax=Hymenobacter aranciens TaxID=3063996 RepID=A0ABT9BA58_9BACT|nr:hypothetical protein [Hymenobacter sp. ASUV-10]MDO7875150.1 hypothetical protein [Hymenobacter sp. ASUV-10]
MVEEPEDNRLDQSLRDAFDDYELTPSAPVWKGIEQRLAQLPPPVLPRRRRRLVPLPLLFGLVALLAGLGGWLLPHGGTGNSRVIAPSAQYSAQNAVKNASGGNENAQINTPNAQYSGSNAHYSGGNARYSGSNARYSGSNARYSGSNARYSGNNAQYSGGNARYSGNNAQYSGIIAQNTSATASSSVRNTAKAVVVLAPGATLATVDSPPVPTREQPLLSASAVRADSLPNTLRQLLALETTYAAQAKPSLSDPATASRAAVVATLRAERAELLRLQRRTDSLLLALGDLPAAAPLAAQPDTAQARPELPKPDLLGRRWSLLLTAAPEQNTVTLQGRPDDKLSALRQGHETGRAGFSAALAAEYKATPRLSVGGGLGYSQFGTEFRLTNRRTEVDVTYDTTTNTTLQAGTTTIPTYSIRITQVPVLTPAFNGSGQVIGYDTVYTPRQDTTFTTIVLHDTLRTTTRTVTPLLNKREVTTTQTFKPQYRFLTLPVQLRYRITPPGTSRWWTDVALGAQVQFFLGGTQAVTSDGENYRTEKITAGNGPFRPVNLALSGSLALNYALTNRLSMSVAPSLRWQALSVYKTETGLRQQSTATGVLLGVRWAL